MDLVWLLIPAAIGLFGLRTWMIGKRLKRAAAMPSLADLQALRDAKAGLSAHRQHLQAAVGSPKAHLAAAKGLSRVPATPPTRSSVDRMVEDFLPDRRL